MTAYYNEIDPYAAEWLRNLIKAGHIAPGFVDERSIVEVEPDDLEEYDQCHFFAGIGGWSLALRMAGVPDDYPVWTGSCPCQPFSAAGGRKGTEDERHLWPEFFRLIAHRLPSSILGEQVAGKGGLAWLDLVSADLEGANYAFRAADLCAASVGAPHRRQRLYWVAHTDEGGCSLFAQTRLHDNREPRDDAARCGEPRVLADGGARPGPLDGFWRNADWLLCRDGAWRPDEPGSSPLAPRDPRRVGMLRAYGNAICAPLAAEFLRGVMDALPAP